MSFNLLESIEEWIGPTWPLASLTPAFIHVLSVLYSTQLVLIHKNHLDGIRTQRGIFVVWSLNQNFKWFLYIPLLRDKREKNLFFVIHFFFFPHLFSFWKLPLEHLLLKLEYTVETTISSLAFLTKGRMTFERRIWHWAQ